MAKRKLDRIELMKETENLLLAKGYEGFHFKGLSERLNIGRSTIYEYYANKEELITDYMKNVMADIFTEIDELKQNPAPLDQLKGLLYIFVKHSQVHQIIQMIPLVDRNASPAVKQSMDELYDDHKALFRFITDIIERGQQQGEIRQDFPSHLIASVFFNAILITQHGQTASDLKQWSESIFKLIYEGLK